VSGRSSRDLEAFSRFALQSLNNLPNAKDLHTSFSLGEVKAGSALPLAHLQPVSAKNITK
jgi:Lrp/AsnC family transcriptional regulator, leucine-responsive regulatory protein